MSQSEQINQDLIELLLTSDITTSVNAPVVTVPPTVIVMPITFVVIETASAVVQPTPVAAQQTPSGVGTKPEILVVVSAANNGENNLSTTTQSKVKEEPKEEILTETNNMESPLSPDTSKLDESDEEFFTYTRGNISLTHTRKKHRYN